MILNNLACNKNFKTPKGGYKFSYSPPYSNIPSGGTITHTFPTTTSLIDEFKKCSFVAVSFQGGYIGNVVLAEGELVSKESADGYYKHEVSFQNGIVSVSFHNNHPDYSHSIQFDPVYIFAF